VEAQAARAVNLGKTYGTGHATVRALDNVSVAFERGQFTAVMGAYRRRRALVGPERGPGAGHDHRHGPADRCGGRVRAAARGPGGAGAPEPELLSHRELEVLGLVAAGTTNRETAARLFISEATVKTHLLHIYAKLGVTDRAAAVAEAFNRGLLTPGRPRA
jgi:DNA-binding CsgD family transcriptional regulator